MDASTQIDHEGPSHLLVAGIMIALAAVLTLGGIGLFFSSGAVADDPADPAAAGAALAGASGLLVTSAYLSVAGNVALAIGALMLAHAGAAIQRDGAAGRRVAMPGVWATFVLATLLILPFDLALPRGLIPLARADPGDPVFAGIYETVNLTHSVGLVVFYLATTTMFARQAHTATKRTHRNGWRVMTFVSFLAIVVGFGLILERPPLLLVPAVFLTWAGVLWLGVRMALDVRHQPDQAASAAKAEEVPG